MMAEKNNDDNNNNKSNKNNNYLYYYKIKTIQNSLKLTNKEKNKSQRKS